MQPDLYSQQNFKIIIYQHHQ